MMKFTRFLMLTFLAAPLPWFASAQDVAFNKENFPTKKSSLREALKAIKRGDQFIDLELDYLSAIKEYQKAYKLNPNNAELNLKIGLAFLANGEIGTKPAIDFLENALRLNPEIHPELLFYLGKAHHLQSHWDKAIHYYKGQHAKLDKKAPLNATVEKRIAECESGKLLSAEPVRVFIDNMGKQINTPYPEFGLLVTENGGRMVFTSRRRDTMGREVDADGYFFEDIYETWQVKGNWTRVRNMGDPVNSNGHDGVAGMTADGKAILLYKGDNQGDIFISRYVGKNWSKPVKLDGDINSAYRETSACFDQSGNNLYFTSDREGKTQGGLDIFVSQKNSRTGWAKAKNLGKTINSPYDEEGVFLSTDGQTLYFSSKGHNSIGGYDIFKSSFENGEWSEPVNLGIPINTPGDDLFFTMMPNNKTAYYSTFRPDGEGDKDLYQITFLGPEKPLLLGPLAAQTDLPNISFRKLLIQPNLKELSNALTVFKGKVLDVNTKAPIRAAIQMVENDKNQVVARLQSDPETGAFTVTIPSGANYGLSVQAPGYLFHSENFTIPLEKAFEEVEKDILLGTPTTGSKIVLNNIFFDTDASTIRKESLSELENVVKMMKEYPEIRVEISGHTDNVGSATYNLKLSEERAKAVVEKLIEAGIDESRLSPKGYGFEMPIADNSTEEGRQKNRRTEFMILGDE